MHEKVYKIKKEGVSLIFVLILMSLQKLVTQLRPRLGNFIPSQNHGHWLPQSWEFTHKDIQAKIIKVEDLESRKEVKKYMRKHFFNEAPIPKALGFAQAPKSVHDFLEREMDLTLDMGGSLQIIKDGQLAGAGFVCLFPADDNYQVLEGDCSTWHNAAAILAKENEHLLDPRITWRDLQYQHIYNLCQRVLRRYPDKKGFVWASMWGFTMEVRKHKFADIGMTNCAQTINKCPSLILGSQSNFTATHRIPEEKYQNPVLIDEAKYIDEELEVNGVKVLKTLSDLDNMKFYADLPS